MRRLVITRKKRFVGALIPYLIHFAYPGTQSDDPESQWAPPHVNGIRIKNGRTVSIPIREERCAVVVSAIASTGAAGGPAFLWTQAAMMWNWRTSQNTAFGMGVPITCGLSENFSTGLSRFCAHFLL